MARNNFNSLPVPICQSLPSTLSHPPSLPPSFHPSHAQTSLALFQRERDVAYLTACSRGASLFTEYRLCWKISFHPITHPPPIILSHSHHTPTPLSHTHVPIHTRASLVVRTTVPVRWCGTSVELCFFNLKMDVRTSPWRSLLWWLRLYGHTGGQGGGGGGWGVGTHAISAGGWAEGFVYTTF